MTKGKPLLFVNINLSKNPEEVKDEIEKLRLINGEAHIVAVIGSDIAGGDNSEESYIKQVLG